MRDFARELVRFGPHDGAHRAAIRCTVSIGVPMLVLLLVGRFDLLGAVAFGAFAAIFGRDLAAPARTKVQAFAGAGLVVSVAVGIVAAHLPGAPWLSLLVLVAVAGVATVVGGMVQWKPPGPLFFVFAAGAFAGAPPIGLAAAAETVVVTAVTAAFAVLVGSVGALRRGSARMRRPLFVVGARQVLATDTPADVVVAGALAGVVAVVFGVEHVYWAVVSAIVPATLSTRGPWQARSMLRILGTLCGLAVAAPLLLLDLSGWAVVLVAVVCQLLGELFIMRNYGLAMVFITPLALVLARSLHPVPAAEILGDRLLSTVIGVAAGVAVLAARAWWQGRAAAASRA